MDSNNEPIQKSNTQVSIRDRIDGISKKLAESKQALREWVQEQEQKMDVEETELRNKDAAIDATELEEPASMSVSAHDDMKLKALMAQAEDLISKSIAAQNISTEPIK